MQNLFSPVITQFKSNLQYQRFIKKCQKDFDIRIYRLSTYSLDQARNVYHKMQQKYENKVLTEDPCGWYENERRLYVWYILCYMKLKSLEPVEMVDGYNRYWIEISSVFWGKTIPFLKYQLLSLIKAKGRISWKKNQDDLLLEAYKAHQKGEWNQIAKQFYFNSNGTYFKTAKQCRERWQNHLNCNIQKGKWSVEEDRTIFQFILKKGNKWSQIREALGKTRTEHMVKNRYRSVTSQYMNKHDVKEEQVISLILKDLRKKQGVQAEESIQQDFDFVESQEISPVQQQLKQSKVIQKGKDQKNSKIFERSLPSNNMSSWKDKSGYIDNCIEEEESVLKKNSILNSSSRMGQQSTQNFFDNSLVQGQTIPVLPVNNLFENRSLIGFNMEDRQLLFENDSIRSRQSSFKYNQSFGKFIGNKNNFHNFDYSIRR